MTWTYGDDPAANNRDEVRYLVGDTDTTDQQVNDAEITYAINNEPNNISAAARTAKAIAALYARRANKAVGDLSIDYSDRMQHYLDLEKELRAMAGKQGVATPYVGGISITDKETVEDNDDRVEPRFEREQFDNDKQKLSDKKFGRCL